MKYTNGEQANKVRPVVKSTENELVNFVLFTLLYVGFLKHDYSSIIYIIAGRPLVKIYHSTSPIGTCPHFK